MTYCPYLDDECTELKPECGICYWALQFWKDEIESRDELEDIQQIDPFDDIEDVACFINFLDENNNEFLTDEDILSLSEDEILF